MKYTIKATNIKCGGCANSITNKLSKIDQIQDIQINIEQGDVSFTSDEPTIIAIVKEDLASMGYPEDDPSLLQSAKSYISCMVGRLQKENIDS